MLFCRLKHRRIDGLFSPPQFAKQAQVPAWRNKVARFPVAYGAVANSNELRQLSGAAKCLDQIAYRSDVVAHSKDFSSLVVSMQA